MQQEGGGSGGETGRQPKSRRMFLFVLCNALECVLYRPLPLLSLPPTLALSLADSISLSLFPPFSSCLPLVFFYYLWP